MRTAALVALNALLLLAGTGCLNTRFADIFKRENTPREPTGPLPNVPTREALVDYLNANSERIRSMRIEDMSVRVSQGGPFSPTIGAMMMVDKPRNFMLQASMLGKTMLVVGSNNDEFWFWNSKDKQPYQYYCSYRDFNEGRFPQQLPIAFQPEWLLEVMGLGSYGPADRYQVESDNRGIRLVEKTKTPHGKPIRKVILFNRREVQVPTPQVTGFQLLDEATGRELVTVQVAKTQLIVIDAERAAIIPLDMEIRMNDENLRLGLIFKGVKINPNIPEGAFVRRPIPGVQSFDLARGRPDGLQQAGSQ
jgi:hypothetical protein